MSPYTPPVHATSRSHFPARAGFLLTSVLLPLSGAHAHPGEHGTEGFFAGMAHFLTSVDHLMVLATTVVVAGLMVKAIRQFKSSQSTVRKPK